jgi:hypothetical protein
MTFTVASANAQPTLSVDELKAAWQRVLDARRSLEWPDIRSVVLSPVSPLVLTGPRAPEPIALYGLSVVIDPSLEPGEIRLVGGDGKVLLEVVNINTQK